MSQHLHRARRNMGWFLVASAVFPLALCMGSPISSAPSTEVTGRVTLAHLPADDMILCLDAGGQHAAYAPLRSDGSFRLVSLARTRGGAEPGHYHAHLFPTKAGRQLASKYADPATSGIELDIASGWNDFQIELP
jgi:hypothetical protein